MPDAAALSIAGFHVLQVSNKNTNDDDEDYGMPIWAGRVPLKLVPGKPEPDPRLDPKYLNDVPEYILPYKRPTEA